jgi:hypothetical protein
LCLQYSQKYNNSVQTNYMFQMTYIVIIRLIMKILKRKCSQLHGRFEILNLYKYIVLYRVSNNYADRETNKYYDIMKKVCLKFRSILTF